MFTAASRLPGITLVESTVDAAGRPGVAVGLVSDSMRVDLIFDPDTYAYLGSRYVADSPSAGLPAGTVVFESALLAVGVVDEIGQLP